MTTVAEQIGKLLGEAYLRREDHIRMAKIDLLMMRYQLLGLELDLFLAGGPIPGERK